MLPSCPGVVSSPRDARINAPLLLPHVLNDPVLLERTILTQGHRENVQNASTMLFMMGPHIISLV